VGVSKCVYRHNIYKGSVLLSTMEKRQAQRMGNIMRVTEFIGKILDNNDIPVHKDIVIWTMDICNVSKKTALEYVEVAMRRLNYQQ